MCAEPNNRSHFNTIQRMFVYFSDPYVKIVLFRGDRDIGQIDTAQTKRLKKVQTFIWGFSDLRKLLSQRVFIYS